MTFKTKCLDGRISNAQEFENEFHLLVKEWHNIPFEFRCSIEGFLGISAAEYNTILYYSFEEAFEKIQNKELFYIPTVEELDSLYLFWANCYEVRSVLRFGQYFYNETNFEHSNSYNVSDSSKAYDILLEGINLYTKKD